MAIRVLLVIVITVPLLIWSGFRIWLHLMPPDFRASIEAFEPIEFLYVVRDAVLPPAPTDRAGYGRPDPGVRGHSPWVLRSSLDGRPRILSIALAPDVWLAYSTETASIHQLWEGDIDFTGPVYDARHGYEPTSRGNAHYRPPKALPWYAWDSSHEGWGPASVRWRGHGFSTEPHNKGALWLRFDVIDPFGMAHHVTEWPEWIETDGRRGLERRFEVSASRPIGLLLSSRVETAERVVDAGAWISIYDGLRAVHWLDEPAIAIDPPPAEIERDAFAEHDCHTCHNERERVVGPAWSEIALRYESANPKTTVTQLATRIIEGSQGEWGSLAMTPHPDLARSEAEALVRLVLDSDPAESPRVPVDDGGAEATWSYGLNSEPRPETLHPALRAQPIEVPGFTPQVGGLGFLPDGRLVVATWDRDGSVYTIKGWRNEAEDIEIVRIADGLQEPLGLTTFDGRIYVLQKQELTQLIDHDIDNLIDEYRTLSNAWTTTSNFHEFGFGLVHKDNHLYGTLSVCVLNGGKSCRHQTADRGKVFRFSLIDKSIEFIASGLRTPNGVALGPRRELFVTDNQGDWLPSSKLIRVREGDFYGWRAPGDDTEHGPVAAPALWLAHNEVGASPTQPLFLTDGPYAGHVVFGDIFNGGLKRAYLEEIDGRLQGAAFHFSGGLQAPVNRIVAAPTGEIVVGQIGSNGNWGEFGKQRYGLEVLRFTGETAFEPMRVAATAEGFDIHFSRPIASDLEIRPEHFRVSHWFYVPSEIYGGPKYDLSDLDVTGLTVSSDREAVALRIDGLKPGYVVYLNIDRALRSQRDEELWVNEAWYTLNAIPKAEARLPDVASAHVTEGSGLAERAEPNTLSEAEREAGWRLLFDGESFAGWKIYGATEDENDSQLAAGWVIEDGALKFIRDVSFAGLVWNHINPFSTAALDLMTRERFDDFELSIDWKISPGGNSGIFYAIPNEETSLSWELGLEMQVLDDAKHSDGEIERHRSGDLYDLQAATRLATRPVGEWNRARIRVVGDEITHWLNGERIVDITRGSSTWNDAIQDSKFADVSGFGLARRGHIALQDHGDVVWYRNIKLRELSRAERTGSATRRSSH